ncbi:MAG: RagB/SusD family nutrient uptake outer membrane protein [Bacteroidales bacterium]|nr:RagB/SusD family nutrient uptake outer membrane protein [Bacteroidales bacterium]MBQ6184739.1 RagB/SusD family nutrient uptake outer membrane protein [Bacteroidales bacterium]
MKKVTFCLILLATMMSCNDRLDLQPYGVISEETFYTSAADAEQAVTAAYKSLQCLDCQDYWNTRAGYIPMGDVNCADAQAHPDLVGYYQIQQCVVRPDRVQFQTIWERYYQGLLYANIGLEKIPDIDMDQQLKSRLLGELYFLRGFWHFRLGFMFGTAPVVTKKLLLSELDLPNSKRVATRDGSKTVQNYTITESELFDQAESDFKAALSQNLANKNTGELMGRADKGATKAYLAHLYLYEHRWTEAKKELEDIMSYGYSLLPDFGDLFDGAHDNNAESVFEIQYTNDRAKTTGNFATTLNSPNGEGYSQGGGWGWTRPTPDLEREFEEGDPRLVNTMFRKDAGDDFHGQVFVDRVNGTGLGTRKWCVGVPSKGWNNGVSVDPSYDWCTSANFALIRYAEVLLWYAEVMNELGDQKTAAEYVNKVRKRTATTTNPNTVNITETHEMAPIPDNLSYTDMFWAIVHERRVELAMEGKFGWDLRRWGIAKQVLTSPERWQNQVAAGYFQYKDDKDELFPIPQLEIDRSNGILQQNPGY